MSGAVGSSTSGGIFIGGTVSKLDTTALIEAAVAQKNRRAVGLENQVKVNTNKITAYQELDTLTKNLESSLKTLRGPESLFDTTPRVFDQKAGTLSTSNGIDPASLVNVAIESDAEVGNYEIEVIQKAQVAKVASGLVVGNTSALGYTGSFTLGLVGGGSAQIDVTAGQSLNDVAASINALTDTTGVNASVLKVSETEFRLVLSGEEAAQNLETFVVSGDDVLTLIGLGDGFNGFQNTLQVAQQAHIKFDGVDIYRDDDNFDDLVTGIDIDIKNAAPGTIINLEVGNDVSGVKDAILNFVDSYNKFRDFVIKNQQVSADGVVAEDAILFSDNLLDGVAGIYTSLLGQTLGTGTGAVRTIRDLGFSLGANNKLVIDDVTKLDNAILNNYDDVKAAFASSSTSNNDEFRLTGNTSSLGTQSIVFNLTTNGAGTITGVTANGDGSAFDISGTSIVGRAGTVYAGLRFTYVGTDASVTINATVSQGLADKVINGGNSYTDSITGFIVRERADLQTENTKKTQDAQEIRTKSESFRQSQINKYAQLEENLLRAESLKSQIRAILGNTDDNN